MQNENLLINSLKKGNPDALSDIMKEYQDYIFTVLQSMLRNRDEAQEATQDTFIKVYRSIDSFNGQSKFSTWLYRIAYRTGLDYIKKRKLTVSFDHQIIPDKYSRTEENVSGKLERKERIKHLQYAITQLKEDSAFILRLFYFKEMSLKEVAEITGLSEANVKVKLFRARQHLKNVLSKSNEKVFDQFIN